MNLPSSFFRNVHLAVCVAGLCPAAMPAHAYEPFAKWPAGAEPAVIGKRLAENFLPRKFDFQTNPKRQVVIYPEVCAWVGSFQVAKLTGDTALRDKLVRKFDILLAPDGAKHIADRRHVDYDVFGAVPLEIYLQTRDPKFLELGRKYADAQWAATTPDGITAEARYWVDDMYMINSLQIQAWKATGDKKYLDRSVLAVTAYLDRLQTAGGLFYHAPDVPFYWARGNGWFAVGMTELISVLPEDHPQRARILRGFRSMMGALLKYQDAGGLWHQLVDHPESWLESSGSGMFTYAMITGTRKGWLDAATYGPAARKGWLALVGQIDELGDVQHVCEGTDKLNDVNHYLNRKAKTGDLHGQAAVLWCASALLR